MIMKIVLTIIVMSPIIAFGCLIQGNDDREEE